LLLPSVAAPQDPATAAGGDPAPAAGAATVVFFRGSMLLGAWVGYTISDQHTKLGKLKNGTYFSVQLPAGPYDFVINDNQSYSLKAPDDPRPLGAIVYPEPFHLTVEPGQTYYVLAVIPVKPTPQRMSLQTKEYFEAMKPALKEVAAAAVK
jgi:hypothetical protein